MSDDVKDDTAATPPPARKPFVEPEISRPFDVLEATQFMLQSGGADAADTADID